MGIVNSKKKNKHGFSNFTLLNFLDNSQHKLRRNHKHGSSMLGRSPLKPGRKKESNRQGNSRSWKEKKANKSIFSVVSI